MSYELLIKSMQEADEDIYHQFKTANQSTPPVSISPPQICEEFSNREFPVNTSALGLLRFLILQASRYPNKNYGSFTVNKFNTALKDAANNHCLNAKLCLLWMQLNHRQSGPLDKQTWEQYEQSVLQLIADSSKLELLNPYVRGYCYYIGALIKLHGVRAKKTLSPEGYAEVKQLLTRAIEYNESGAMNKLAKLYLQNHFGDNIEENIRNASDLLNRAIQNNHPGAMNQMSQLYLQKKVQPPKGTPQAVAIDLLNKACKLCDVRSMYNFAFLIFKTPQQGKEKRLANLQKALQLLALPLERNNSDAQRLKARINVEISLKNNNQTESSSTQAPHATHFKHKKRARSQSLEHEEKEEEKQEDDDKSNTSQLEKKRKTM